MKADIMQGGGFYGAPGMFAREHVRGVCADPQLFPRLLGMVLS